jgi:homoserine O-acetyltransferase
MATNAIHSPWGIALNETQRMAIEADPTWKDNRPDAGQNGLAAARAIALLSYRNYYTYKKSQTDQDFNKVSGFKATTYQQYQGKKLVDRFNVASYWTLTLALDSHNVGRNRGGVQKALSAIVANTLVIGIKSDILFPVEEQVFIAENIPHSYFVEFDSDYGHDGFLIEYETITKHIRNFYEKISLKELA